MVTPRDFYDDRNHQQLYMLEHLYGLPEFVKKAGEDLTPEALAAEVFADARQRKFPCHTKVATWLANAYFQLNRDAYAKDERTLVQGRLTKYAQYWKISGLVESFDKAFNKLASFTPAELPDEQFALVVTTDEGQKLRKLALHNPLAVKNAGESLYANRYQYPYSWRKTAARRILKAAFDFDTQAAEGVKLAGAPLGLTQFTPEAQSYLERAAGFGVAPQLQVAEKVAQRVFMVSGHQALRDKLAQVAQTLQGCTQFNPEQLSKLASVIDAYDRDTGLCEQYVHGVDLPEEMFFDLLEKEAADILDSRITLTTGNTYPVGLLAQLPLAKVAEVLGAEFSQAVTSSDGLTLDPEKVAEVLPTLPRSDALLLERIIDQATGSLLSKEARAPRIPTEEFDKENLSSWFKDRGHKVKDLDYKLAVKL